MDGDVVGVRPEPGYRLFVRFKDGLSGRVQLVSEELTGVLSPLAEPSFFERVFVDQGAVTWPGCDARRHCRYQPGVNRGRGPALIVRLRSCPQTRQYRRKTCSVNLISLLYAQGASHFAAGTGQPTACEVPDLKPIPIDTRLNRR
jgi:hypothetical protein